MRRRALAGRFLSVAYALLLGGLVVLFARWPQGPGWGFVSWALLACGLAAFGGALLPRRLRFVALPLLFLGGLPAQVVAFLAGVLGPGVLYQPFRESVATPLTAGVFGMVAAWFVGFFLLVAAPPPRPAVAPEEEAPPEVPLTVVRPRE